MAFPDLSPEASPFQLATDASNLGIGAVLSQCQNGVERVIGYASRTLRKPERNYSTIEKEALAIVWAVSYFRSYLYGNQFVLTTDHKPLSWLKSFTEPKGRLARWILQFLGIRLADSTSTWSRECQCGCVVSRSQQSMDEQMESESEETMFPPRPPVNVLVGQTQTVQSVGFTRSAQELRQLQEDDPLLQRTNVGWHSRRFGTSYGWRMVCCIENEKQGSREKQKRLVLPNALVQ